MNFGVFLKDNLFNMKISCIVIDDDPLATRVLQELIEKTSFLNLLRTYPSAQEVIFKKEEILQDVDLIFLDVEMPGMTGIEFLSAFEKHPFVIIVSSKKNYAVDAFEFEVADYLTKPVSLPRFFKATDRIFNLMQEKQKTDTETAEDIFFKTDKGIIRLDSDDVFYIEALENYIKVFTEGKTYVVHHTLKSIIEKLPQQYIRIHRSYIVNVNRIHQIQNNIVVVVINGERKVIPVGKAYQKEFFDKLNIL